MAMKTIDLGCWVLVIISGAVMGDAPVIEDTIYSLVSCVGTNSKSYECAVDFEVNG